MKLKILYPFLSLLLCPLFSAAQSSSASACLVRHYSFDNNINDLSSSAKHLTWHGGSYVADRDGNANSAYHCELGEYLSGTTDLLPLLDSPRTLSVWLYLDFDPDSDVPVMYGTTSTNSAYGLAMGTNVGITPRGFRHAGWNNDHHIKYDYPIKKWFNVVGTYDGDSARFYVDGVKLSTSPRKWSTSGEQFLVGKNINGNSRDDFNGAIDELKIYNCVLSDSQIKQSLAIEHVHRLPSLLSGNPTTGLIKLGDQDIEEISILGTKGELLHSSMNSQTIDISHISAGVYYLVVRKQNGVLMRRKVIKL